MRAGDFSGLAENYSKFRPGYAPHIFKALQGYLGRPFEEINACDIGAGTGIFTRMLQGNGCQVVAVEPNADMRTTGQRDSQGLGIEFVEGQAENTNLPGSSFDLVSMASSFHWADFAAATTEFHRILRAGGCFMALWNPRKIVGDPFLEMVEAKIKEIHPGLNRVSSGYSGTADTLWDRLNESPLFDEVLYVEAEHVVQQSKPHYIGVWESVNDVRSQLGEMKFSQFIQFLRDTMEEQQVVRTVYKTRCWLARVVK